ncbi:hypothetical protein [Dyadobacter psychrotolerans]|uniref:Uncharacterized protein n=1 Tax=Dyadobacter psychrotolerans TaxID=2541721 RepID=A0A4R5DMC6_9BACT|nr:hypothetical protein [Dyadobacter psychrotolerans]TDE12045.1 hypothetical protein E0F88_23640 [Dyadobacter psychrotolerans]
MTKKKRSYIIFAVIALVIGYIIFDSTSQPNVNDLKGNFKEVAVYRNENNTGPIVRVYAVTVQGEPWEEMQKYGDLMPYTKYGSTKVYFFDEQKPFPKTLKPGEQNFESSFNSACIASYTKDPNGQVSLNKNPF